jgi:hypothetical protein
VRLSTYVIGVPVVVVTAVVAIANRQMVTFSLDPFSLSHPSEALSVRMPLFVLLILTLAIGAALGGIAAMWSRRRRRKPGAGEGGGRIGLPARLGGSKPPEE